MMRMPGHRSWRRLFFGVPTGIALALGAAGPASAAFYASSQLCYGGDCSEMGYDGPVASVSDTFHRDVDSGVPNQTGYFDETATADAAARQVTFDVGFLGGELLSDVFLASTPTRPRGSLTLIAFMGAVGEDDLTITAPGLVYGFVSLDVSLEAGGINGCTAVGGCATGLPFVSPDLNLQFFSQANGQSGSDDILQVDDLTPVGGFSQHYTSPQIAFTAGTPFSVRIGISGTMSLRALFDDPSPPDLFISGSTLTATAIIEQLHVFDASHQPVAGASIVASTGTDWTTTLPEPSGVASSCAAALGLVAVRRRRRVASADDESAEARRYLRSESDSPQSTQ